MKADLGHLVYSIGLTGDFRSRPFDTVDANVAVLSGLLRASNFESCLFISTTRLYGLAAGPRPSREDDRISISPVPDALYDASKLLGELLCMTQALPAVRVVRLSNVYGAGQSKSTFLGAVMAELKARGEAVIRESPLSAKDYVALADILPLFERIALAGRQRIYNVASGRQVQHRELAGWLARCTGLPVRFEPEAQKRELAPIDISRVVDEFAFSPALLMNEIEALLHESGLRGPIQ